MQAILNSKGCFKVMMSLEMHHKRSNSTVPIQSNDSYISWCNYQVSIFWMLDGIYILIKISSQAFKRRRSVELKHGRRPREERKGTEGTVYTYPCNLLSTGLSTKSLSVFLVVAESSWPAGLFPFLEAKVRQKQVLRYSNNPILPPLPKQSQSVRIIMPETCKCLPVSLPVTSPNQYSSTLLESFLHSFIIHHCIK